MSPLPDIEPSRHHTNSVDVQNKYIFFNDKIDPDQKWVWTMYHPHGQNEQASFFEERGVEFKQPPLEEYDTREGDKLIFHRIYSTPHKGFYLKLDFYDYSLSREKTKIMLKNCFQAEFIRLGENANREYIESITNG